MTQTPDYIDNLLRPLLVVSAIRIGEDGPTQHNALLETEVRELLVKATAHHEALVQALRDLHDATVKHGAMNPESDDFEPFHALMAAVNAARAVLTSVKGAK